MQKLFKNPLFLALLGAAAASAIGYLINQLPAIPNVPHKERWVTAGVVVLTLLVAWLAFCQSRSSDSGSAVSPSERQARRNRQAMLTKVKNAWVKGVLEKSLHQQVVLTLGMEERPDAVAPPWQMAIGTGELPTLMPENTPIITVFDQLEEGRTLLILGEPGAGKTITLLQLARDLIDRAEQDETCLIPVVFNLSSWQGNPQSIAAWLIAELNSLYQVPKTIAKAWVEQQQLLLLLDGLDEVKLELRQDCLTALNAFQQDHSTEMVVCSRIQDYQQLHDRLTLQTAIYLRPLTTTQINEYFDRLQVDCTGLRTLLASDRELQTLAKSPLLLNIMVLTYEGSDATAIQQRRVRQERQAQLFDDYIDRMFERSRIVAYTGRSSSLHTASPYSRQQATHWLTWLAQKMIRQSQTTYRLSSTTPCYDKPV
jgi:eukaryotic-like serine/threonine-protein kinase